MSKDIWHKAGFHEAIDDKLKVSKDGKWVYWTMYGWNIAGEDAHDIGCDWAYLDDLLALETKLDRTRKALDVAVDEITKIKVAAESVGIGFFMTAAIFALEKIKTALEQKDKQ